MTISPDRAEYLRRKYIDPPNTPEQAAIAAEAEQIERTISDLHYACEDYNKKQRVEFINWELPSELRERINRVQVQLREAQSRDSWARANSKGAVVGIVFYDDDRNKHDQANGWPAYDPDMPHHQTVPLGVILAEPNTVHVLRGGTGERIVPPSPKWHQSFADESKAVGAGEMADFGQAYDFPTFMARADYRRIVRFCDMGMPGGCKTGIGGGDTRLIAVPMGKTVYVVSICELCVEALAKAQRRAHKNWRWPRWLYGDDRTSDRWWLERRSGTPGGR